MTSSNMITLTPQMKKQMTLHGSLSLPLRIGERAWITHGDFSIVTSPVKRFGKSELSELYLKHIIRFIRFNSQSFHLQPR